MAEETLDWPWRWESNSFTNRFQSGCLLI